MLGWLFLIGAFGGAWHTVNAVRPAQPRRGIGPLWLPALLTGELVPLHFVWQAVLTSLFIWGGALSTTAGVVALVLTLLSWIGMVLLTMRARGAAGVVEGALEAALGEGYAARIVPSARTWSDTVPRPRLIWRTLKMPPEVVVVNAVPYGSHPRQAVDIYLPKSGSTGAPVLLQIHGGSWMRGRRDRQARPLMYHLAAAGWVCIAPSYRVSPEVTYPDHLIDLKRAVTWIRRHGAGQGWDTDFIAVTGGSAGGHLAAMLALTANRAEYQPGFEEQDTSIAACIPVYGIFELVRRDGIKPLWPFLRYHVMKTSPTSAPDAWRRAAPIHQVHADAPPFLVLHGAADSLVRPSGSRRFVRALRDVSTQPVVSAEVPGGTHGFDYFATPRAYAAVRGVARFLGFLYSNRLTKREDPTARRA